MFYWCYIANAIFFLRVLLNDDAYDLRFGAFLQWVGTYGVPYLFYSRDLHIQFYIQIDSFHRHYHMFPGHFDSYIVLDNCLPTYFRHRL